MTVFAASRKGKNKSENDDRIIIGDVILNNESRFFENIYPHIIGIADGVGGNAGGNIAAQFVCEKMQRLSGENLLYELVGINDALLKYAAEISEKSAMATTFSAVVNNGQNQIIHIGNTRIYALQGNYLKQLTTDHTTYNWLCYMGRYDEAKLCNKSEIIRCFVGGVEKLFNPDISDSGNITKLIFTSDGIHDFVDIDTFEEIIFSDIDSVECCEKIMAEAIENGSCDDMSIIIMNA